MNRLAGLKLWSVCLLLLVPFAAQGADCIDYGKTLPVIGELSLAGWGRDIVLDGDLAYAAVHNGGIQILDISDPANVVTVGICDTPNHASDLALRGDHLYVADDSHHLQIIDVADPAAPTPAAAFDVGAAGNIRTIEIAGDTAYVSNSTAGLYTLDLTDPTAPAILDRLEIGAEVLGIDVVGGLLYTVTFDDLYVVNASDPASLAIVGGLTGDDYNTGVRVVGDHAYLATLVSGLAVVDVSDPAAPARIADLFLHGLGANEIEIAGDVAYLTNPNLLMMTVDISDPYNPVMLGERPTDSSARGLAVRDGLAYVVADAGLSVVDATDPNTALPVGMATLPSAYGHELTRRSDLVWWLADFGIGAVDVADPSAPVARSFLSTALHTADLAVVGDYAYVAGELNLIQIFDIADPAAPELVGHLSGTGNMSDEIAGLDDLVVVKTQPGILTFLDVSSAPTVTVLTTKVIGGGARDMALKGDHLYIADLILGLRVFDVSNPSSPTEITHAGIGATGLLMGEGRVYLNGNGYLQIIDITTPAAPVPLTAPLPFAGDGGMAVRDDLLYVATDGGARVIDIGDPAAPETLADLGSSTIGDILAVEDHILMLKNSCLSVYPPHCADLTAVPERPLAGARLLGQNYPNPFNPTTTIAFDLPASAPVELAVYDLAGRKVRTLLADAMRDAGTQSVNWNGLDDAGRAVASGVYLYRLEAGDLVESKTMTLIR